MCSSPAANQLSPKASSSGAQPTSPTSPTSPGSPTSITTPGSRGTPPDFGEGEALFSEIPVRLWRLMAWCVNQDPKQRPQRAEEVLRSGLIREDVSSPYSPPGQESSPKDRKKKKEKKDRKAAGGTASISDLLKL